MKFFSKILSIGLFSLFLSDVHGADFQVNGDSIKESKNNSQEWLSHGRTYDEQRFSELNQVNTENIDRLGIEWFADLDSNRGHEATPIVSDGVMFSTGAWIVGYAHNAVNGELLWKFDPKVPKEKAYFVCDYCNSQIGDLKNNNYIWHHDIYGDLCNSCFTNKYNLARNRINNKRKEIILSGKIILFKL